MSIFNSRRGGAELLSFEGRAPAFEGATGWLNSEPLTPEGLRGKVVAVDFWTYTCINWLRTLPYVRAWAQKYEEQGLVVVGVHTPEFSFEHEFENVRRMVGELRVPFPVATDPDFAVWDAFANRYWPALYLVDREGSIRFHHFGEGRYGEIELAIQELLGVEDELVSVEGEGLEAPAEWDELASPETYLGHGRGERFASTGDMATGERQTYASPPELRTNQWALDGDWTIRRERTVSHEAGGRLTYRFHARDVHLVMGPHEAGASVRFRVAIDGQPPGEAHGDDVDADGIGTVDFPRLYQLVRQRGPIRDRTFELTFLDPGGEVVVFTFG